VGSPNPSVSAGHAQLLDWTRVIGRFSVIAAVCPEIGFRDVKRLIRTVIERVQTHASRSVYDERVLFRYI
jgi:hypothetical protein